MNGLGIGLTLAVGSCGLQLAAAGWLDQLTVVCDCLECWSTEVFGCD